MTSRRGFFGRVLGGLAVALGFRVAVRPATETGYGAFPTIDSRLWLNDRWYGPLNPPLDAAEAATTEFLAAHCNYRYEFLAPGASKPYDGRPNWFTPSLAEDVHQTVHHGNVIRIKVPA